MLHQVPRFRNGPKCLLLAHTCRLARRTRIVSYPSYCGCVRRATSAAVVDPERGDSAMQRAELGDFEFLIVDASWSYARDHVRRCLTLELGPRCTLLSGSHSARQFGEGNAEVAKWNPVGRLSMRRSPVLVMMKLLVALTCRTIVGSRLFRSVSRCFKVA